MLKTIRHLLAPPVFEQDEQNRVASLLTRLLQIMFVTFTLLLVISEIITPSPGFTYPALVISTTSLLTIYALLHRGRLRQASLLVVGFMWLLFTGVSALFMGILGYFPAGYVLCIVLAGATFGRKGVLIMTGVSILSTLGIFLAETTGLIHPFHYPGSGPVDLLDWAFLLALISVFVLSTEDYLRAALVNVRRNEQAQLAANRELMAIRESLEERVTERTAQLQVSADVSRAVSAFLDQDELISQVVNLITQRFHFYYAAVFLTDTGNQYAVLREATGEAGQELKDRGYRLEIAGQSMVGLAIQTREPRLATDVDKETLRFSNPLLADTRSEAALPLVVGSRVLGALDVQSRQVNAFDESTVAMLSGLANQIAIALSNAQSYQTARADAQIATALFEASQTTGFLGEDLLVAVNRLFGVVAQRSDFDTWLAARYDANQDAYTILTAFDANEPAPLEEAGQTFQLDRGAATPATLAILAREAVIVDDPDRDVRLSGLPEDIRATLGKFVSAPAIMGDRVLGAIVVGRTRFAPSIGARDVQLAQALASQLAMTIANRELFDQAQTAAAELNQLMRLYTRQGWEDYTKSRSMDVIEHEYQRADATPIDLLASSQAEESARAGHWQPVTFDGQAVFGVPITLRGEVLGTLQVQDDKNRAWTDEELATLQAVSDQVAQSIEAARLLAQSETNLLETTTLYEVSRALSTAPTLTDALQLFVKTIFQRLKADQVALALFDDERGYGTLIAEAVPTQDGAGVQIPMLGNPSYERLIETKRPIAVYDIHNDPVTADVGHMLAARGVKSMLIVPLIVGQKLVGSFGVDSNQLQRKFSEQEIAFCETLARQAAGTVERYQLFEQTQISLEETRALYQASRGIAAAQTPSEILLAVSDSVAAPHIDRVLLALSDPDSPPTNPELEIVAAWERGVEVSTVLNDRWTAGRIPLVARNLTEPLVLNDVEQAAEIDPLSRRILSTITGMQAAVIVPLLAGGRTLGWIVIESLKGPYVFGDQEVRRYRTLAGQATVALENRRLFQDVEARVNELTVLTRISRRLASTLELDEVLSLIVDESISTTQAQQASIALYNEAENALEVRVMRGFTPEMEHASLGMLIRPGQGLHGRVLTTGRAVLVADVKLDTDYRAVNAGTRSEFIVPIRQGELLLGALNLESPKPHAFADTDVRLIEALADQVAVAITNARAYEAERQAVERMREVDRLKTQFLANMSHELRTPLNSIIGFSRVILRGIDGPISELQQTDLTSIYNSGQHLLSLINNILDLSKIEAGKMELSIEPLDLRDIAKSVMSTAIALVKDKAVRLNQDVPDDAPTVMADQTRVRQIMLNLVSNAAKFTEKGSITLRVKAYPKEVHISVTDTGIGVAADKLEHIFEEFTQADASTTRRYGGTGLGLAITKKFVEMHKGRIWIESQVGVGSTFTFTLPREQVIEEPEPTVSLPTDLEARGEGKKLVMCIDDDPGVITLYKRYLEKQGYQVIGLTDSSKAVDEARRLLPFAITLDVLMPNRDGWDVLADLKKTPEISNTPIVLCSIIHDKSKGFSLGAADYLVKPITEGELLGALERVRRNTAVRRVLVVDDEPDALNLLKRLLEAEPNYEVITAPGGAEALAAVQADKPDLIILDLMMPDIDGFAVLDNIKSSTLTRHIPVIIVTAKELTAEDRARLQGKTVATFNKGMFTADQLMTDIVNALQLMNGASVTVLAA
ncbi:MAG: GAF domain-containing protein [Chloroflexi bacterium]|nr:GAF domain-containing protein [Chloroflexota bacterium]